MHMLNTFFGQLPEAVMSSSPIRKRLELAKVRARSYPMDSMDFVLNDLEQPASIRRHADFCTGDLTGRYLEMLARSEVHDSGDRDRMDELFRRIMKCQSKEGPFGLPYTQSNGYSQKDRVFGIGYKVFPGLLRYFMLTGDSKALYAAKKNAEFFFDNIDFVKATFQKHREEKTFNMYFWITEPFALLYSVTGDPRCIDVCRIVAESLPESISGCHTHGLMTALRGLQLACLYTGDLRFNEPVERMIAEIARDSVWADGNIPEVFPMSERNEGCSIADWVMLNLYSGLITGNAEAYERAELAFYNALALNQIVNGGFGCRYLKADRRGYQQGVLHEECWWCCLYTGANAIVEYAGHSVTIVEKKIHVNLFVPGKYIFDRNDSRITVEVVSAYPEKADAVVMVDGMPQDMEVEIRIPSFVRNATVSCDELPGNRRRYVFTGDLGYYIEDLDDGQVLKYGPLIMAPLRYVSDEKQSYLKYSKDSVPEGYIPPIMPKDYPSIVPSPTKDKAGFLLYDKEPWPIWQCFEEGVLSPLAYGELSVNVPLFYPDGGVRLVRFYPELNSTTTLIGLDLPIVFDKG